MNNSVSQLWPLLISRQQFSSERFSMQRYSMCPVVKYRFANGFRIFFTAAFRKSKIDFHSPPHFRA